MLGSIFRRLTHYKQRVGKKLKVSRKSKLKQNVEIDNLVSSGREGKYMKYVSFSWSPLEALP
jgi:hypothetical protein